MGNETVLRGSAGKNIDICLLLEEGAYAQALARRLRQLGLRVAGAGCGEGPLPGCCRVLLAGVRRAEQWADGLPQSDWRILLGGPVGSSRPPADFLLPARTPPPLLAALLDGLVGQEPVATPAGKGGGRPFPLRPVMYPCPCFHIPPGATAASRCFVQPPVTLLGRYAMAARGEFRDWLRWVHEADRPAVLERYRELSARGWIAHEYRLLRPGGGVLPVTEALAVIRDGAGQELGVIGCCCPLDGESADPGGQDVLLRQMPIALLVADAAGCILLASESLANLLGYREGKALVGMDLTRLVPEGQRPRLQRLYHTWLRRSVPDRRPRRLRLTARHAGGGSIPLEVTLSLHAGSCDLPRILVLITDRRSREWREERRLAIDEVRESIRLLAGSMGRARDQTALLAACCRMLVERAGYGLAWAGFPDEERHWLLPVARSGATDYLGEIRVSVREEEPEGRGPAGQAFREERPVISHDLRGDPAFAPWREAAERQGLVAMMALPLYRNGRVIGVLNVYAGHPGAFDEEERRALEQVGRDLSRHMERIEELRRLRRDFFDMKVMALRDPVTGLYARPGFLRIAGRLLERHADSALVVLEPAQFQEITRSLGYARGDELLRRLAHRLRGERGNLAPSHLGDGTFAFVLADVPSEVVARNRLERRLAGLEAPVALAHTRIGLLFRVGVALAGSDGVDAETLLRRAVLAKDSLRDAVGISRFLREMEPAPGEAALLSRLLGSVDRGELELHYQPLLALREGRCDEVEVLVRWRDPEHGLISPGRFVPVLERAGLMDRLTRQVLELAIEARSRWPDRGRELKLAINISAQDLAGGDLPDMVAEICRRNAVAPTGLVLELTETAVLQELPTVTDNLERLRGMGVTLSIDDFGTGHASLSRLVDLPMDQLKVDQRFVTSMLKSRQARIIVAASITLGRQLGLEVVAEGVEEEATLSALRELGCDRIQGHFVSYPLPERELLTWLTQHG